MEKLLVRSNFSFSHSVLKRLVLQTLINQGLFGKELVVLLFTWYKFYLQKMQQNLDLLTHYRLLTNSKSSCKIFDIQFVSNAFVLDSAICNFWQALFNSDSV